MADYLLQPADPEPQEEDEKEGADPDNEKETKKGENKARSQRSNLVIFAVDISGSMSTTVEVPALQAEWSSVTGRGGGGGGPRYISRLEAIKEAVCRHLEHMSVTEPRNKVGGACLTEPRNKVGGAYKCMCILHYYTCNKRRTWWIFILSLYIVRISIDQLIMIMVSCYMKGPEPEWSNPENIFMKPHCSRVDIGQLRGQNGAFDTSLSTVEC